MPPSVRRIPPPSALLVLLFTLLAVGLAAPSTPAHADETDATGGVSIDITEADTTVDDVSGYHIVITLTNNTDGTLAPGTLTLSANARYTFVSRTDIQQWAEGANAIPTPDTLHTGDIAQLAPGASSRTTIDVPADDAALQAMTAWGPKPVQVDYRSGDGTTAQTRTFLTRSFAGLNTVQTPAMNITVVMPLTGGARQADDEAVKALQAGKADAGDVTTIGGDNQSTQRRLALIAHHDGLQIVADPDYLAAIDADISPDALMQPAGFDITGYAALDAARSYKRAGVPLSSWSAQAALDALPDTASGGGTGGTSRTVAWQGSGRWTQQALTTAKQQGYDVVIASEGFDDQRDGTVHTGTYEVDTDAGTVTVLSAQGTLSALAQGQATDGQATAERTAAGRLARFVAQSAFYQMEQPYTERNLLVCLSPDSDPADVDALMTAIEQASWLKVSDLDTLLDSNPYLTGEAADGVVPTESGMSDDERSSLQQTLATLGDDASSITRFRDAVLDVDADGVSAGKRQQANDWAHALIRAQREFALHALGCDTAIRERMTAASRELSQWLYNAVSITPTETVTVVSETASMPVTIRNQLPYPVAVRVDSLTDSMQIVTSRQADATVPADGEEQVTFTIRVATSGTATARLTLQDRTGAAFGASQSTTITSSLQLSDMSGLAFVVAAAVLGLLGLWRQFHRKKDPDE